MPKAYLGKGLVDQYDHRRFGGASGRYIFAKDCALLESLMGASGRLILDVPCGTGIYSEALKGNGNQVVAADASMAMLERTGQRRGSMPRVLCDANQLPFQDDTFDVAMMVRLSQHLPRDEITGILHELQRVIKAGGRVVFDTFHWSPKQVRLFARLLRGEFHVLSHRDAEEMIAGAGLSQVREVSAYLFSPIMHRKLPLCVVQGLNALEKLLPQRWLLRTFWACTKE